MVFCDRSISRAQRPAGEIKQSNAQGQALATQPRMDRGPRAAAQPGATVEPAAEAEASASADRSGFGGDRLLSAEHAQAKATMQSLKEELQAARAVLEQVALDRVQQQLHFEKEKLRLEASVSALSSTRSALTDQVAAQERYTVKLEGMLARCLKATGNEAHIPKLEGLLARCLKATGNEAHIPSSSLFFTEKPIVDLERILETKEASGPAEKKQKVSPAAAAVARKATALWEFNPQGPGQQYMQRGDVVQVVSTEQKEWWMIQTVVEGQRVMGWVPANYVRLTVEGVAKKRRLEEAVGEEQLTALVDVVVPYGVGPGESFICKFPCGQLGLVTVPEGMGPGGVLKATMKKEVLALRCPRTARSGARATTKKVSPAPEAQQQALFAAAALAGQQRQAAALAGQQRQRSLPG